MMSALDCNRRPSGCMIKLKAKQAETKLRHGRGSIGVWLRASISMAIIINSKENLEIKNNNK